MAKELSRVIGEMTYDGLVSGLTPQVKVGAGVITKGAEAAELKRGTVLAKADGKLSIHGSGKTADCILAEDIEVGTDTDVAAAVYEAGCFDPEKVIVADGYILTEEDKDALRQRGIYFAGVVNK